MYQVTKTYGFDEGLSTTYRQHKALSHCRYLHGYAFSFTLTFQAKELDELNWVIDFGSLKGLRNLLHEMFDHRTYVAQDDPHLEWFKQGEQLGVFDDVIVVERISCEFFAKLVFDVVEENLQDKGRVKLVFVKAAEHAGNSAMYIKE